MAIAGTFRIDGGSWTSTDYVHPTTAGVHRVKVALPSGSRGDSVGFRLNGSDSATWSLRSWGLRLIPYPDEKDT